jgi:hypothetical protein
MKQAIITLFAACSIAQAASTPDWIIETPLEFISAGRFQAGSAGDDLVVVDKATGLARIGLKSGADLIWSEQATGISGITGFTTLRNGTLDSLAATSAAWNAVQLISPSSEPTTVISPVLGPQTLVRLSTGHTAASTVEDALAFSTLASPPAHEVMGAVDAAGSVLFQTAIPGLPQQAQFIPIGPAPAIPVLVSVRSNQLRVDVINRTGFAAVSFNVGAVHAAGLHWAAARTDVLYSVAKDGTTLFQYPMVTDIFSGWWLPINFSTTINHALPDTVLTLDTIPWADATVPRLDSLVAIRHTSTPDVLRLYRVWHSPTPTLTELTAIPLPAGHEFAGLIAAVNEFILLSGPGGRVQSWSRFAQPAAGALPVEIASGSLPALRTRAANPNIFIFDQDPLLTGNAVLISSQNRLDWTRVNETESIGESDLGTSIGLGDPQAITIQALGGVPIGNQLLDSASVAGTGPVGGLMRASVTFYPEAGRYAALDPGETFPVRFRTTVPSPIISYRIGSGNWVTYDDANPPELTADATVYAFATGTTVGTRSLLATGNYSFAALPPATPAPAIDADLNGLSDAWERAFGITDPNSDPDNDGFNAITEQNAGTDPLDPNSRPDGAAPAAAIAVASVQDGVITLVWPEGLAGHVLETSPDLHIWTAVDPQPTSNTWSEPITDGQQFYRLHKP